MYLSWNLLERRSQSRGKAFYLEKSPEITVIQLKQSGTKKSEKVQYRGIGLKLQKFCRISFKIEWKTIIIVVSLWHTPNDNNIRCPLK